MGAIQFVPFPNDEALAAAVAAEWLQAIAQAQAAKRRHCVALSGGRIAGKLFAAVAEQARSDRDAFRNVEFFWADERCVPPSDRESNFQLAHELLFQPLAISDRSIHRIPGERGPEDAAASASGELRRVTGCPPPTMPVLDLVLLGMGEDGHVASLFPGDAEAQNDVASVFRAVESAPKPPPRRVTLGPGAIAAARDVWVLASGPGKEAALRESLALGGRTPLARIIQRRALTRICSAIAGVQGEGPQAW